MKLPELALVSIAASITLFPAVALAQSLPVQQDTYVSSGSSTNKGSAAIIVVGGTPLSEGLIQFDLSKLPANITEAQVEKATLTLFVDAVASPGDISISEANGTWAESAVVSSGAPTAGALISGAVPVTTANEFLNVDVTQAVKDWLGGVTANDGLIIQGAGGVSIAMDSKENTSTSHPAILSIVLTGPAGPQGPAGAAGPAGAKGATGAAGPAGPAGAAGAAGVAGPAGPAGAKGAAGAAGPAGPTGAAGAAGVAGPAGPAGAKGAAGAAGPAGPTGAAGAAGPAGANGSAGAKGAQGIQGAQGAQGAQGPVGPAGPIGPQGPPVSFSGAWNGVTAYQVGNSVSFGGTSYIALVANSGVNPSTDVAGSSGHWAVLAAAGGAGPAGATGNAGANGVMGPQGPTGPAGATGSVGPAGPQGPAGPAGPQGSPGAVPYSVCVSNSPTAINVNCTTLLSHVLVSAGGSCTTSGTTNNCSGNSSSVPGCCGTPTITSGACFVCK